MRLHLSEVQAIVLSVKEIFGDSSSVYLFGSRVDDSLRGGDIDLYIDPQVQEELFEKKIKFLTALDRLLGEQKVDVVIAKDADRVIEHEAMTKGVKLDIEEIKLQKYFDECDKHIQRINDAYGDMQSFMPLSSKKYQNLTKDEVQDIDQYLFRFSKLQDTMGDKIFKVIIHKYEQSDAPISFVDILNKLEKYGFIDDAKEWINLRKIRNIIAHQYDDEPAEMAEAINNIVYQKKIIEEIYFGVKDRCKEVFL